MSDFVEKLKEQIENTVPDAEQLPEDIRFRLVVMEEGFALLMKEAAKSMQAMREEAQMRDERPEGPTGEGWEFTFYRLVGEEAGILHSQTKGLLKLGQDPEMQEKMSTAHKKLVAAWAPLLPKMWEMYDARLEEVPQDDLAFDYIEQTLRTLKVSHNLFQGIANGRAKRLGPKRAALARFNAESARLSIRKRQQEILRKAIMGEHSAEEKVEFNKDEIN